MKFTLIIGVIVLAAFLFTYWLTQPTPPSRPQIVPMTLEPMAPPYVQTPSAAINTSYFLHSSKRGLVEAVVFESAGDALISSLTGRLVRAPVPEKEGGLVLFWCGTGDKAKDDSFLRMTKLAGLLGTTYNTATEDLKGTRFDPQHGYEAYLSTGEGIHCYMNALDDLRTEAVVVLNVMGVQVQ